ncbi:MAG: phenylalanine--tRNA ligase subunit beta, partial [Patescibacteria group bacterium]
GMLCAEDELGLGTDHGGIIILDPSSKVGEKFTDAYGLNDVVFDLAITAQRADLYSIYGLAREVAAITGAKMKKTFAHTALDVKAGKPPLLVLIKDASLCPRYRATYITGLKKSVTPAWMRGRLLASGVRPIHPVVDITNYVMLETGQPLHAFDYDKLTRQGTKVVVAVRPALKGEQIKTLDAKERELDPSVLVIADAKHPIALAGVMGGRDAEVTASTKDIILEAAIFPGSSVRKTSLKFGLRSEASLRFEKGIGLNLPEMASARAVELFTSIASGKITHTIIAEKKQKFAVKPILVHEKEITGLIGVAIPAASIVGYLKRLGCEVTEKTGMFSVLPPAWRLDMKIKADIIEEIGRLHGWNSVTPKPLHADIRPVALPADKKLYRSVQDAFVMSGFTEIASYSFYGSHSINALHMDASTHYEVANPFNSGQQYMRTTLAVGLLEAAAKNMPIRDTADIFELGRVFHKGKGTLPHEERMAGALSAGKVSRFSQLKGALNNCFASLGIDEHTIRFEESSLPYASVAARMMIGSTDVGYIAEMDDAALSKFKIRTRVSLCELSLDILETCVSEKRTYRPLSPYPAVVRDFSFVVKDSVAYAKIEQTVLEADPLISHIEAFDVYPMDDGVKSIAIRVTIQPTEATLTSKDIDIITSKITTVLEQSVHAQLRLATERQS